MMADGKMTNGVRLNPDLRSQSDPQLGMIVPAQTQILRKVSVRPSLMGAVVGLGVFAEEDIRAGDTIFVGGGQVVRNLSRVPAGKDYCGVYDEQYFVAPTDFENPSPNWLMNHSCNPNTKLVGRIVILARCDIERGSELTIDYATVGAGCQPWKMTCHCGEPLCRHVITNEDWRDDALFHRYYEEWPSFLQRQQKAEQKDAK
jgi:hypothetical protein